jgi:hypothetical protein
MYGGPLQNSFFSIEIKVLQNIKVIFYLFHSFSINIIDLVLIGNDIYEQKCFFLNIFLLKLLKASTIWHTYESGCET